jgi:hypothetical protein
MPSKVEAFGLLLVLLPGFFCAYIVQALAVRRSKSDIEKVIESLIFSLFLYLSTLPFFGYRLPLSWQELRPGSGEFQLAVRWFQLGVLSLASLIFGVAYAASINHDWIMRFFRWIRVTKRTSQNTIWNDVFGQIGGWVQVGLTDAVIVKGWLAFYSDDPDEASLFLEEAAWIDADGKEELIDGPGILITKQMGIEYVVFLHGRDQAQKSLDSSA